LWPGTHSSRQTASRVPHSSCYPWHNYSEVAAADWAAVVMAAGWVVVAMAVVGLEVVD
jgi:hypothetical protein